MRGQRVVVSGAAGAWGDSSLSTAQLIADGRSDYIVYDGLAEITMAILARARQNDPTQGYARDLIEAIASNLDGFVGKGMRVVTNAGGVNPVAAAAVIRRAVAETGREIRVATVTGDDLTEHSDELRSSDEGMAPGETLAVNAYLGASPIAVALGAGADVVVTGRVVDSALVLGPLIHEFGWSAGDYDLLSAGSLAGHLLECGPQSTGGLLTDWEDTPSWVNPGFPIAEVAADGGLVLTAPDASDALVDVRTVSEQLLYEIGDPREYLLPDVTCDWSQVTIALAGPNRVEVSGAKGGPPPATLKACAQVADGWRAQSLLFIGGRDAVSKARRVGFDLVERGRRILAAAGLGDFRQTHVEVLGSEDTYGPHARRSDTREVMLKIAVHHDSRDAVAAFVREVPSVALAGPPGVSGGGSGLPRPTPLIRLDCFPVPRHLVTPVVEVDGRTVEVDWAHHEAQPIRDDPTPDDRLLREPEPSEEKVTLPLVAIAHGRSGDKGADINIGIRARHPDFLGVIDREVTAARVGEYLAHLGASDVTRYYLSGIDAFNFVLVGGLGAGGAASLRFDPQGKAVAQQLLDMEISVPVGFLDHPGLRVVLEVSQARVTRSAGSRP